MERAHIGRWGLGAATALLLFGCGKRYADAIVDGPGLDGGAAGGAGAGEPVGTGGGAGLVETGGGGDAPVGPGDEVWSKRFGHADPGPESGEKEAGDQLWDLAVDDSGNVVFLASAGAGVDFGGGVISAGYEPTFLVKLDPNGQHVWSKAFGGPHPLHPSAIAAGPSGELAIAGSMSADLGGADFGGGEIGTGVDCAAWLACFDAAGGHRWSHAFATTAGCSDGARPTSLAMSPTGVVVATGHFMGTIDFGGGPLTAGGSDPMSRNAFVACS
ncbi:MAG: hypothetical protein HY744_28070 [Deltaproteobacteria bacterium]|nr:hypothetical protein [Deltaproteobacteria bacterium]